MTVVDAVTKLHELEYEAGVEGVAADNPYGFYCFTKIWGMTPEYNTLALIQTIIWMQVIKQRRR